MQINEVKDFRRRVVTQLGLSDKDWAWLARKFEEFCRDNNIYERVSAEDPLHTGESADLQRRFNKYLLDSLKPVALNEN